MKSSLAAFTLPRHTLDPSPSTHWVSSPCSETLFLHSGVCVCLPTHTRSLHAAAAPTLRSLQALKEEPCSTICLHRLLAAAPFPPYPLSSPVPAARCPQRCLAPLNSSPFTQGRKTHQLGPLPLFCVIKIK